MSNGQVERFNSTFCDRLKRYCTEQRGDWDEYLLAVVWAYNSGVHAVTKFTPYELAFNRQLLCPFETKPSQIKLPRVLDYWEQANRFRQVAIRMSRENISKNQMVIKARYDKGRTSPQYKEGDWVWVRVLNGRSKFDACFHGPFEIVNRISEVKFKVRHVEEQYQQEMHLNDLSPYYDRS